MEDTRDFPEHDVHEQEDVFFFGDDVMMPNGEVGKVTEIDGDSEVRYRVDSSIAHGWFKADELTKVL